MPEITEHEAMVEWLENIMETDAAEMLCELVEENKKIKTESKQLREACKASIRSLISQQKYITDDCQALGHNEDAIKILQQVIAEKESL